MNSNLNINKTKHLWIKSLWIVVAVIMYTFFGMSFVVGKDTMQSVRPFFFTALRMIFASIVIFLIQCVVNRKNVRWPKGMFVELSLLTLFNVTLTNCLEFWGLQYMTCYKTCYIYSLSPFLAALFSFIFLKEKLGRMKLLGLAIAFIGFAPLFIYKESQSGGGFYVTPAEWALLGAAFSTVIGWIAMRKICYQKNYPFLMANAISMFFGGLLSFIPSLIFESWSPWPVSNWSLFIQGGLIVALINNIIGYNLYAFLVRRFTVTLMSFIGFITPLITALFGWIFLKENVSLLFFVSYGTVLIGFFFFTREELVYNTK